MRRRIILTTLAVAAAGILVLGVPLAIAARQVVRNDALRRLDRQADSVGFAIDDDIEAGRPLQPATLARLVEPGQHVEVTDPGGRRTAAGPTITGPSLTTAITLNDGVGIRVTEPRRATDRRVAEAVALVVASGSPASSPPPSSRWWWPAG